MSALGKRQSGINFVLCSYGAEVPAAFSKANVVQGFSMYLRNIEAESEFH
jgi:hypothetical protein